MTKYHRLKTTEIDALTVLETKSPKSRCQPGCAHSEASKGGPFMASVSFWGPLGIPWLMIAPFQSLSLWSRGRLVSVCLSPFYEDTSYVGPGPPNDLVFNWLCCNDPVSRQGHIHRCCRLELQCVFWSGGHGSTFNMPLLPGAAG